jgi:hypothetical protein
MAQASTELTVQSKAPQLVLPAGLGFVFALRLWLNASK